MSQENLSLARCEEQIGYRFRNSDLLRAAMTHASSAGTRLESNERMEFLGDSVLSLVICEELYQRLPNAMEGELTKIKSAVVSRRICARVAESLRLADWLALGQGISGGEQTPRSLLAAVLEAVVAAIYLDGGLEAARRFVLSHMGEALQAAIDSEHQFNYKSHLQQYAQRRFAAMPHYELLDEKGPDHSKCFEVAVVIGGQQFPSAWGPSKKEAEQKAARLALVMLGQLAAENGDGGPDSAGSQSRSQGADLRQRVAPPEPAARATARRPRRSARRPSAQA
jgi:ribonuclease-3